MRSRLIIARFTVSRRRRFRPASSDTTPPTLVMAVYGG